MMLNEIMTEEKRKELVDFLTERIRGSNSDREAFLKRVDKWRRQREALPAQAQKDFPWPKSSNLCLPIAAMRTDMIASAFKAAFSQKHPFFNIDPHQEGMRKAADALSEYLDVLVESKFHLNLREVNNTIFYDLASLGTQFVMVPWVKDVYTFKRKAVTGELEEVSITKHQGPQVVPIRIEDFFTESHVTDLQTAPWLAIRHYLTLQELRQREYQGIYENIDAVAENAINALEENAEKEMQRVGLTMSGAEIFEIYECFAYHDVDDDGIYEDVKIWIELQSGAVLREELNDLGVRNIVRIPYKELPNQLYAMGVGWMCEHEQEANDALFNMAVNSTHISSLQMFGVRRTSTLSPKEDFYPLKQIVLDEPGDLVPITFPNTAMPNLSMISATREMWDRFVGANNAMTGSPDSYAKTRSTASGYMFQAQQGSRLFDAAAENVENAYGQIGMLIFFQLINHIDEVDFSILPEEKAKLVEEVLRSLNMENIHLNFAFSISSTQIEQTEEAKRQRLLTMTQMYSLYGQKMLQLAQGEIQMMAQVNPQGIQPLIQQYMLLSKQFTLGSTKLMEQVIEEMSMDRDGLLPYVKDIELLLEQIRLMKEGGMNGLQQDSRALPNPIGGGDGSGQRMGGSPVQENTQAPPPELQGTGGEPMPQQQGA